ncbi:MAG: YtxH domain-containing protein [Bacteroidota bacterium]|nr:YtxH domain-containing protein [Bacteroidota bacterium]
MSSGSKVLLGVLAGAATGAILGVLFAPDKGDETRRRISEGSRDVTENLKAKFGEFVDGLADRYETVKDSATDLLDQGKQKASNVVNALKSDVNSAASNVASATGAATGGAAGAAAGARAGAEAGSGSNQM